MQMLSKLESSEKKVKTIALKTIQEKWWTRERGN